MATVSTFIYARNNYHHLSSVVECMYLKKRVRKSIIKLTVAAQGKQD